MRIEKLDLIAYGPFSATQLEFGQGDMGGLHLVYGPNEAGKSSALTAVLDFFFGFPNRSASTFQHQSQKVRVGATVSHAGQSHSLVRRKGRKDTLLSASSGEPFDDSHLDRYLAGMDRKRYEAEFGISYAQLVAGGRELANGKGDLASALFAVASGSQKWLSVKRGLEDEAKKLFLSRGSLPKINALIEKIAQQKKDLAQLQLLPSDWDRRQAELSELETETKKAQQKLAELTQQVQRLQYEGKLQPLLVDYFHCRQHFLSTNVRWLPDEPTFADWETQLESLEQDLVKAVDRRERITKLQKQLSTSELDESLLELGGEIDNLLQGRTRFADSSVALLNACRSGFQLKEDLDRLAQQLQDQFGGIGSSESTQQPETVEHEKSSDSAAPLQTMFWDDSETESIWYQTDLSEDDKNQLDLLAEELESLQKEQREVEQQFGSLKQKLENVKEETVPDDADKLLSSDLAKQIEDFLETNSELTATCRLQNEWSRRRLRMEAECDAIVGRVPELSDVTWSEIVGWKWPEPQDTEPLSASILETQRQADETQRERKAIDHQLEQTSKDASAEEAAAGDAVYSELEKLVVRSTDLVVKSLANPESLQRELVSDLYTQAETLFEQQFAGEVTDESEAAHWLGEIHSWCIKKLLQISQLRVEKSDQLADFRQRELEIKQWQAKLSSVCDLQKQNNQSLAGLQKEWDRLFNEIPVNIQPKRILSVNQAVIRVREMGGELEDLRRRQLESESNWLPVLQQLDQLVEHLPDSSLPPTSGNTPREKVASKGIEHKLQQLKAALEKWRRAEGQNQQALVRKESLRQRMEEMQQLRQSIQDRLQPLQEGWRLELQSKQLPAELSVPQYQQWRNSRLTLDELDSEWHRVANRVSSLQKELRGYLQQFDKISVKVAEKSNLNALLNSDTLALSKEQWNSWYLNWQEAESKIENALNVWKDRFTRQNQQSIQRAEWSRQLAELNESDSLQLNQIKSSVQKLLDDIQSIAPGFRLKQDLDVASMPLEHLSMLVPELGRKIIAIEQLIDDACILDSRLEGIAKLEGGHLLSTFQQTRSDTDSVAGSVDMDDRPKEDRLTERSEQALSEDSASEASKRLALLQGELQEQKEIAGDLASRLAVKRQAIEDLKCNTAALEKQQAIEMNLAELEELSEQYLDYSLSAVLLDESMTRHSQLNQHPILSRATDYFERLTLGSFLGLKTDLDSSGRKVLLGERRDSTLVDVQGMSEGTETQLYLSLRIAALEHFLTSGDSLPFVVDDVLKDYDDQRALAALKVFAELGQKTQVILFTHHEHLLELVQQHLEPELFRIHRLQSGHAQINA